MSVAAGTPVRLELARITNTNAAISNAAISITTKNAGGTIIDGPTTAPITIKNIGTADIGDSAVATVDIANNAITSSKVANNSIVTSDLANNAVTGAKITDGNVLTSDMADKAVTSQKIAPGSIVPFTNKREGSSVVVEPGTLSIAFADCLAGEKIAGGGYLIDDITDKEPLRIGAETTATARGLDFWAVVAFNPDSIQSHSFRAMAFCMPALP